MLACSPALEVKAEPQDCSADARLAYVEDIMLDAYLWADHVEPVDRLGYSDPAELMADLRYDALDRWSYVRDLSEATDWFDEGAYVGGGYSLRSDAAGDLRFALVYPDNPAHDAGLRRGDRLLRINGFAVEDLSTNDAWNDAYGPVEDGAVVVLGVERPDGDTFDAHMVLGEVTVPTVYRSRVFEDGDRTVLYFMLTSFVEPAHEALDALFDDPAVADVDTVVVDLRYNGGGLIAVARHLAALVARDHAGEVFMTYWHNAAHAHENTATYLEDYAWGRSVDHVVFLTSGSTGSASEMLMFSLEPYVPVTRVGGRTSGKPVGMNFFEACDLFVSPVTFQTGNRDVQATYFDGLEPDCAAEDNLLVELGADDDPMLVAGLQQLAGAECPDATARLPVSMEPSGSADALRGGLR
mgnify:FL=1